MKLFVIFLWFFLFVLPLQAQSVDTKVLTAAQGLISNNVQATYVDVQGNLWLGSRAGLSVKKGTGFEPVSQAVKYKFNNIYDILEDADQGKWIAGYGQGLLYFNESTSKLITEKSGLVHNTVRSLFYHNQKMYVGTLNGVSVISTNDFSMTNPEFNQNPEYFFSVTSFFSIGNKVYATTLNDGIYEVTSQKLIKVSDLKRIFSSYFYNNHLYIGTEKELYEINATDFKIIKTFIVSSVHKFLPVNNELYLVSSGIYENKGGLFQLKNDQLINKTNDFNIPFTDLKSLAFDTKNRFLYAGSNYNGLIQINLNAPVFHQKQIGSVHTMNVQDNKQFVFHDAGFSIISNNVKEKNLSLADFKNFQKKNPSKYQKHTIIQNHFYPLDYETPAEKIIFYSSQIYQDRLWVASNIGLFELDLNGTILTYHPVHIFYFTFFNNDLIAAVPYAGVRVFHNIHKMNYSYFHDWNQPDVPAEIVSIAQTAGAVYFASALSGLYEYKNGKFRSLLNDQSFTEPKIKRICITKEEYLVVVTDFNDVYILDVSHPKVKILRHIPHDKIKGSTTNFVNDIDGVLYVGTNLGINIFKENRYFFIDRAQGFTDYNSTMATPYNNSLYIGTKQGFFEVQNDYFNQTEAFADEAVISEIFVNNRSLPKITANSTPPELKLNYNQNNIRLLFSVPNAKYPDKIKFKYRLKSTELWQELMDENLLSLNYLNDGDYEVALQIANEDTGNISVQHLLKLTIKPPFYYTRGFILACALIIIAGSWAAYKGRIRYLKKNQERELALAALQNEQEKKELLFEKQLADVMLQALKSQMNSHFLFNVLGSIQYFILCKDVDNALYYLERFSQFIRTTLDYSDKKTISLYEEIAYLKQYIEIENLRAENTIVFKEIIADDLDSTEIKITPLLLQPFVENAIIHAFPPSVLQPEIELKVEKTTKGIQITLTDNGVGYQPKTSKTHQSKGISIAENRLGLTQKNLQKPIEISTSSNGTQVVIFID